MSHINTLGFLDHKIKENSPSAVYSVITAHSYQK